MPDGRRSPDEILAALRFNDGTYQREMVDAAIAWQDVMIPRLIDILNQVSDHPDDFTEDEDRLDHIYALMLLGHLRATGAHEVIINELYPEGIWRSSRPPAQRG